MVYCLNIDNVIHHIEKKNKMAVSIALYKAWDKTQHACLIKTLIKQEIEISIFKLVKFVKK